MYSEYYKSFFLIIPTRNRIIHLSNLLSDLKNFHLYISKVIIIDQSVEDYKTELCKLQLNYEFVYKKNDIYNSVNNSRNLALNYYNEEQWLFFLDDDLRIEKKEFDKILFNLNSKPIDVLVPGIVSESQNVDIQYQSILETLSKPKNLSKSRIRIQVSSGLSIVNKKYFRIAGYLFDENFTIWGDDWDFGMRLFQSGAIIYYQPDILIDHLKVKSGGQRDKALELNLEIEKVKLYFYFIRKHFSNKTLKVEFYIAIMISIKILFSKGNIFPFINTIKGYKLSKCLN